MSSVTYTLADVYAAGGIAGATVDYNNGLTFDILAALVAGGGDSRGRGGSFVVTDPTLQGSLQHHPAVKITGTTGGGAGALVITEVEARLPATADGSPLLLKLENAVSGQAVGIDGNPVNVPTARPESPNVYISDYGPHGDGVILSDFSMLAGQATGTSPTASFTQADVNKAILVSGVNTSNADLVTTIQSVQDSHNITLAAAAVVDSPDVATARIAVYGTDDSAAIEAASDAAGQFSDGVVIFDEKIYVAARPLQQGGARKANSQIRLPYSPTQMSRLTWNGKGGGSTPMMPFPTMKGTIIASLLTGQSYSATYGIPSVVGGPTREQLSNPAFSFVTFDMNGIMIITPRNPSLTALNCEGIGAHNRKRCSFGTLEWGYQTSGLEHLAASEPTHPAAAGAIDPRVQNQQGGAGMVEQNSFWGYYCAWCPSEHTSGRANRIFTCKIPIGIRTGTGVGTTGQPHMSDLGTISVEANPYGIAGWDPSANNAGGVVDVPSQGFFRVTMDLEDYTDNALGGAGWAVLVDHVHDVNNLLRGEITYSRYRYLSGSFGGPQPLTLRGGTGLSIRNLQNNGANQDQNTVDSMMPWNIQMWPGPNDVGAAGSGQFGVVALSGTWATAGLNAAASIHGGEWFNSAPAVGDEIAFDFAVAQGSWSVGILFAKVTTGGIFQVNWQGNQVGATQDTYNGSTLYNQTWTTTFNTTSTGRKRLSIKVTGKNASSTNFFAIIQGIHLRRTA